MNNTISELQAIRNELGIGDSYLEDEPFFWQKHAEAWNEFINEKYNTDILAELGEILILIEVTKS